jgi:hypothetical protein
LAAEIVEGKYVEKRNAAGQVVVDGKGNPVLVKACTGDAEERVTEAGKQIKTLVAGILTRANLSDDQVNALKPLTPEERREQLKKWGKITGPEYYQIHVAESQIASAGCGVIDFIKFNVKDLRVINETLSQSMFRNASENNRTTLGFFNSIVASDRRVQRELETILNYGSLVALIRELEATGGSAVTIRESKIVLKSHLDELFNLDGQIRNAVIQAMDKCGLGCSKMKTYVQFSMCDTCEPAIVAIIKGISKAEFDRSNGDIERILETRGAALDDRNSKYLDDLSRITPSHSVVVNQLNAIQTKQHELDALLDSSLSALDTWAETHANLRVAVNTKKPLNVAKLTSKVREIWKIIEPDKN